MRRIHLVGGSGHGKTTLAEALVALWTSAGLVVGTIKHSPHRHELDAPGKDSWRHRQAGGQPSAVIAGDRLALHQDIPAASDPYAILAAHYLGCALVLVEGDAEADAPKVEVWRAALGVPPLATGRSDIEAVISDDPVPVTLPCWPRRDLAGIAARMLALAGTRR
jgi:molybdopterin-guanine dinucleotide biosynthesis protein B